MLWLLSIFYGLIHAIGIPISPDASIVAYNTGEALEPTYSPAAAMRLEGMSESLRHLYRIIQYYQVYWTTWACLCLLDRAVFEVSLLILSVFDDADTAAKRTRAQYNDGKLANQYDMIYSLPSVLAKFLSDACCQYPCTISTLLWDL